jgi:hypothetical protein
VVQLVIPPTPLLRHPLLHRHGTIPLLRHISQPLSLSRSRYRGHVPAPPRARAGCSDRLVLSVTPSDSAMHRHRGRHDYHCR